jgi:NADH:ubiquinone oxidoreductase subunit 5 (subunit L)/multisubunit Na+/H+ antiporter MnhA subunit
VLATTGVILTASYMLWMIQRVFYGDLNDNTADVPAPDLDAREHLALWPMVALMLLMGVASPYWMKAIDEIGTRVVRQHSFLGDRIVGRATLRTMTDPFDYPNEPDHHDQSLGNILMPPTLEPSPIEGDQR